MQIFKLEVNNVENEFKKMENLSTQYMGWHSK